MRNRYLECLSFPRTHCGSCTQSSASYRRETTRTLCFEELDSRDLLDAGGADAASSRIVSIPDDLYGVPEGVVVAPLNIDDAEGIRAAEIHLHYDAAFLEIENEDVRLGSVWPETTTSVIADVDGALGTIVVWVYGIEPLGAGVGSVIDIDFTVSAYACAGQDTQFVETPLVFDKVILDEGGISTQLVDGKITILCGDNPPNAKSDELEVHEGGAVSLLSNGEISLLANDTDPDLPNDLLTVDSRLVPSPAHGTVTLNLDGTFTYQHDGSENFADSFEYRVRDRTGNTDTASVSVTVTPTNDPPQMDAIDNQEVAQGTLLSFAVSASDPDTPPDAWTFELVPGAPAGASIGSTTGRFTWIPSEEHSPGTYEVTVRVSDNGVPAGSDEKTFSVRVVDMIDLGILDFTEPARLEAGTLLYYRLSTMHTAWLTMEGLSGEHPADLQLQLYRHDPQQPNSMGLLTTSALSENGSRLDWLASEGDEYYARASNPNAEFGIRIANLVRYNEQEKSAYVHGTAANDAFLFKAMTSASITINEVDYSFDRSDLNAVTFDGSSGVDAAIVYGTDDDEFFVCHPGSAVFSNTAQDVGFTVEIANTENIYGYGSAGNDTVEFYDSPQNDKLLGRLESNFSKMRSPGFVNRADSFETVLADFSSGGRKDSAVTWDSEQDDEFGGSPGNLYFRAASGSEIVVVDADFVIARSTNGGNDSLLLEDSTGDDVFRARPHKAEVFDRKTRGRAYHVTARAFEEAAAYAEQGGRDIAKLYDTALDDLWSAEYRDGGTWSTIETEARTLYEVIAFEQVKGYGVLGGKNTLENRTHDNELDFVIKYGDWKELY